MALVLRGPHNTAYRAVIVRKMLAPDQCIGARVQAHLGVSEVLEVWGTASIRRLIEVVGAGATIQAYVAPEASPEAAGSA